MENKKELQVFTTCMLSVLFYHSIPLLGLSFFNMIEFSLIDLILTTTSGILIYILFKFFRNLYSSEIKSREIIALIYLASFFVFLYRTLLQAALSEVTILPNCINCLMESLIIIIVLIGYKIIHFKKES